MEPTSLAPNSASWPSTHVKSKPPSQEEKICKLWYQSIPYLIGAACVAIPWSSLIITGLIPISTLWLLLVPAVFLIFNIFLMFAVKHLEKRHRAVCGEIDSDLERATLLSLPVPENFSEEIRKAYERIKYMGIPAARNAQEHRDFFICPITGELYDEPLTEIEGTCGHTYERIAIETHLLRMGQNFCPYSRNPLVMNQLRVNILLQNACDLLRPEEDNLLTDCDWEIIHRAAEAFANRRITPVDIDPGLLYGIRKQLSTSVEN